MKNTCLVLGAGFSKAVAELPIIKEMITAFKGVYEKQCELKKSIRINRGKELLDFIEELETIFLRNRIGNNKIYYSNYIENFEGLCSFIDLHLAFEGHAVYESGGITSDLDGFPLFAPFTSSKLGGIRASIRDYLYFTLIEDKSNNILLDKIFDGILNNCSTIVTFNYDLVLEKFLYNKNYWLPFDGYGFIPKDFPPRSPHYLNQASKIKILKMHGSLNWELSSLYRSNLEFLWFDDNNNYFFPGYLEEEKKRGFNYEGRRPSDGWILPSWIKQFTFNEIIQVWNLAFKALNKADEIIFIGYSLPTADAAVYSLFSSIDWDNKIVKLIDPNAEKLKGNYSFVLRKNDMEIIPMSLEDYL